MQVGKILVFPAVDDQPVSRQVVFSHDGLHAGDQVRHERIRRLQVRERTQLFFGDEQHMEGMRRIGVVESQQGIRLSQAFGRDEEAHMGKDPTGQAASDRGVQEADEEVQQGSLMTI